MSTLLHEVKKCVGVVAQIIYSGLEVIYELAKLQGFLKQEFQLPN